MGTAVKRRVARVLPGESLRFSEHAQERIRQMAVTFDAVHDCVWSPEEVTWNEKHDAYEFASGNLKLGIVWTGDEWIVKTCLWRYKQGWAADFKYGEYDGRKKYE